MKKNRSTLFLNMPIHPSRSSVPLILNYLFTVNYLFGSHGNVNVSSLTDIIATIVKSPLYMTSQSTSPKFPIRFPVRPLEKTASFLNRVLDPPLTHLTETRPFSKCPSGNVANMTIVRKVMTSNELALITLTVTVHTKYYQIDFSIGYIIS